MHYLNCGTVSVDSGKKRCSLAKGFPQLTVPLVPLQLIDREAAMAQMDEYQKEMEEQGMSAEQIASMMGGGEL